MRKMLSRWLEDARQTPDTRYVATCDGLRVLAIVIVAWFHIWQSSRLLPRFTVGSHMVRTFDYLVRTGYIWVDVVILIIAFCLYLPWARMRRGERVYPNTLDFYAKRLIRIHPSYLLCVLTLLIVALMDGIPTSPEHLARDFITHLTYTQMFAYDTYYGTLLGAALWTLAVEMQFYLIFPLLARVFEKTGGHVRRDVCGGLGYRAIVLAGMEDVTMFVNQMPAFLDTFALGMAAAELHVMLSARRHSAVTRLICSAVAVLAIVKTMDVVYIHVFVGDVITLRRAQMEQRLALCFWAALLLASAHAGLIVRRLMGNRATRFLSSVSMNFLHLASNALGLAAALEFPGEPHAGPAQRPGMADRIHDRMLRHRAGCCGCADIRL